MEGPRGVSRAQRFVLVDEYVRESSSPADPGAEHFIRYVIGHGPVTMADYVWWSGLTVTQARAAVERAAGDARVALIDEGLYAAAERPRRHPRAAAVIALGSFEEYFISYTDRTVACPPQHLPSVGPGVNGMVRSVVLADGVVIGTWTHSVAGGKADGAPRFTPFEQWEDARDAEIRAALARYAAFVAS